MVFCWSWSLGTVVTPCRFQCIQHIILQKNEPVSQYTSHHQCVSNIWWMGLLDRITPVGLVAMASEWVTVMAHIFCDYCWPEQSPRTGQVKSGHLGHQPTSMFSMLQLCLFTNDTSINIDVNTESCKYMFSVLKSIFTLKALVVEMELNMENTAV